MKENLETDLYIHNLWHYKRVRNICSTGLIVVVVDDRACGCVLRLWRISWVRRCNNWGSVCWNITRVRQIKRKWYCTFGQRRRHLVNPWGTTHPCWLIIRIPSELPMLDQILNISTRSNAESIIKIFYHLTTWFTSSGSDRFEPIRTRSTYFPLLRTLNWTSGSVPATART